MEILQSKEMRGRMRRSTRGGRERGKKRKVGRQ